MKWTKMIWTNLLLVAVATIAVSPSALAQLQRDSAQDNILTYHGSADRSGNFVVPGLTWQRAKSLHADEKFRARVDGNVYAQPLYWHAPGSNVGMLLVATEENNVHALDATTGNEIWTRSLGKPVTRSALRAATSIRLGSRARR